MLVAGAEKGLAADQALPSASDRAVVDYAFTSRAGAVAASVGEGKSDRDCRVGDEAETSGGEVAWLLDA
jgi:hypothetical protein